MNEKNLQPRRIVLFDVILEDGSRIGETLSEPEADGVLRSWNGPKFSQRARARIVGVTFVEELGSQDAALKEGA